ncbi:hypothetical protein MIB92_18000 [Aestuariirhabdus sp. Z084]|uniref:hypothetical protein n=1 Tax=Aestuariirhabdus haliotis TaxID=2918751 RepID=UPI00201B3A27|nr:hypothetical protein [Aestuariirhabdus haliotis]MCL6417559.1 hypothetical protein [Aestuariirhabdus haliotis]MCL6421486.1 hypothetical protein [Aestuariirhabdus haliotis]
MAQNSALRQESFQLSAHALSPANDASDIQPLDYKALHEGNQRRLGRIALAQRCLPLLRYLQHHRGASLAVLNGDLFFESRILGIQHKIEFHLEQVKQLSQAGLLLTPEWRNVEREWLFVKGQWRMDSPIANFNLHSHLINELLSFIKSLMFHKELGTDSDSLLLLGYLAETLLPTLEGIAQIRGLSTHRGLDANEDGDQEVVFKLNYLVSEFHQRQTGVVERCKAFSERDKVRVLKSHSESSYIKNLKHFDIEVDQARKLQWLSGYGNGSLFLSATKLIDSILLIAETSIKQLRDHMDQDLQRWIYRDRY